jgi:DNA modification methylase
MIETDEITDWLDSGSKNALVHGNSKEVLKRFPSGCVDCIVTSPPYWGVREYSGDSVLGSEVTAEEYIDDLLGITDELRRILKPTGSFWINIGDTYNNKNLAGIPWRAVIALQDHQRWILRNDVIWNKLKGNPSAASDRLRVMHEYLFHLVKNPEYYYDMDSIRGEADFELEYKDNGDVVSPTGVSGTRYRRQIEASQVLSDSEKEAALEELEQHLDMLKEREIKDFRMVIRDEQRSTHGDSTELSGRAKELNKNGFYFLRYNAKGPVPENIWELVPEDEHRTDSHCAVYPIGICEKPILATCPEDGIVLDPFVGTGTTVVAANKLQRRAIGIDTSEEYLETARGRIESGHQTTLI